jgi:undecaprenyl diphosphate synthase
VRVVLKETSQLVGPDHVAIIMDGNGRWAASRGMPRAIGHKNGAEAVRRTVEAAVKLGVSYLTLFGFSAENWNRPKREIGDLMGLLRFYLKSEIAELHKKGVRLRVIGDRDRFDPALVNLIESSEAMTAGNNRLNLVLALSYGGRQELVEAARKMAREAAAGRLNPDDIDEEKMAGYLLTAGIPNPDLLIRTSGELRISNFLLWQLAYTELVFIDTFWPDFSEAVFEAAIREFNSRERRYGATAGPA